MRQLHSCFVQLTVALQPFGGQAGEPEEKLPTGNGQTSEPVTCSSIASDGCIFATLSLQFSGCVLLLHLNHSKVGKGKA